MLRPTQAAPGAAASDADAPPWWQSAGWWRAPPRADDGGRPDEAHARQVQWGGAGHGPRGVGEAAATLTTVRLRFVLTHGARLYSFQLRR